MAEAEKDEKAKPAEAEKAAAKARDPKVGRMTAQELDQAIDKTSKSQGGLWSRYGRSLTQHRQALGASAPRKTR